MAARADPPEAQRVERDYCEALALAAELYRAMDMALWLEKAGTGGGHPKFEPVRR